MSEKSYRIAFDIGGTFTDFALLHAESGHIEIHKVLTTPHDPAEAVANGISELLDRVGVTASQVENAIHGTTLVTNALIERKGAKVALLATKGFRDILEIRNEQRYDIYDMLLTFPEPLIPRYLRLGVTERVDRNGTILEPLGVDSVRDAIQQLQREDALDRQADGGEAKQIESVAICFLHSYRNAANEEAAAAVVQALWPGVDVSLSSHVSPEIREYERTSTTVANAYVRPITRDYLRRIDDILDQQGYEGRLFLMLSSGGIAALETAIDHPIQLVESGPAGGAIGAAFFGRLCGLQDLVSFDMGGTTAKISLIEDGRPAIVHQMEAARLQRFKKGSGLPLQVASVELMEIGAGGGSIAWIDDLGMLRIGPESAGADPGPACYGLGGSEPTITDADLVLGYLNPDYFLGGAMKLELEAAAQAIETKIAAPLGISVTQAAWGIHELVNENMAAAARIHIIERGHDPKRYALLAFGGAGPIHASGVSRILNQSRVIYPLGAGVLSAVGFLAAPVSFSLAQSAPQLLNDVDWPGVNSLLDALEQRGRNLLIDAGIDPAQIEIERGIDARYAGQFQEIDLTIPNGVLSKASKDEFHDRFRAAYLRLYRHLHDQIPIEVLTWRVVARGHLAEVRVSAHDDQQEAPPVPRDARHVYWPERGAYVETPVFDRYGLRPGASIVGPAILEEHESTVLIPVDAVAEVDRYLNVIVDRTAPAITRHDTAAVVGGGVL